ncbi:MAG: hypothetical protein ISN28_07590 [Ectothiorhodospiraceae bacterium AqS1]|nr:hypothetical protein [Ectothiorhodospiraceae bacterium AqS1]
MKDNITRIDKVGSVNELERISENHREYRDSNIRWLELSNLLGDESDVTQRARSVVRGWRELWEAERQDFLSSLSSEKSGVPAKILDELEASEKRLEEARGNLR